MQAHLQVEVVLTVKESLSSAMDAVALYWHAVALLAYASVVHNILRLVVNTGAAYAALLTFLENSKAWICRAEVQPMLKAFTVLVASCFKLCCSVCLGCPDANAVRPSGLSMLG